MFTCFILEFRCLVGIIVEVFLNVSNVQLAHGAPSQ